MARHHSTKSDDDLKADAKQAKKDAAEFKKSEARAKALERKQAAKLRKAKKPTNRKGYRGGMGRGAAPTKEPKPTKPAQTGLDVGKKQSGLVTGKLSQGLPTKTVSTPSVDFSKLALGDIVKDKTGKLWRVEET